MTSTSDPLVSVVMIFLNAALYLGEAIDSVLTQRYGAWELLLVDDGSTDGSGEIAQAYAARHPGRIHYLQHPRSENRGMSASRNLGVSHARGRYVAFLDADDTWAPGTLAEQVALLEAHPDTALVYGRLLWWHSWTGHPDDQDRDFIEGLGVEADRQIDPPGLLWRFLLNRAAVPSGIMVRRQVIEEVGGFEESFRGEYEDQVLCAKICARYPVYASNRCWYRYRQHPDSCVAEGIRSGRTEAARLTFLRWLAAYLRQQGVRDPRIWSALALEMAPLLNPRVNRWMRLGQHYKRVISQRLSPTAAQRELHGETP